MRTALIRLLLVLAALAAIPSATAEQVPVFSDADRRRIAGFGPWPPEPPRDPSNRLSGNAAAIAFGEKLFFDRRLARGSTLTCAVCHRPEFDWTDGHPRGQGRQLLDRNTTSLWNVGLQRWFGWDGASDSLWAQSIRPLLDPREQAADAAHIATVVRHNPDLACRYRAATGQPAESRGDEEILVDVGKALAAFQETLISGVTAFDRFRTALLADDRAGMAQYPAAAQRGLALFIGRGNCAACHFGPTFSNGEFADVGIPFFLPQGGVDAGRFAGIRRLQLSPYSLLGQHSDDATRRSATGTRHVELRHSNFGEFKVPGLRNVARTFPYMHNGSLRSLEDVVRHYSELNEDRLHADGERVLRRLDLDRRDSDDLLAFLRSLDDPQRWQRRAVADGDCR